MNSNLPDNVNPHDPNAPWNEKTKEITIYVNLVACVTVDFNAEDCDIRYEYYQKLKKALGNTDFDFEIEELIIE